LLEWLISHGGDVDKRDFQGNTPLHLVARDAIGSTLYSSEDEMRRSIQVLIEGGADLRIRNDDGKTAMDLIKPHEENKREYFEAAIKRREIAKDIRAAGGTTGTHVTY
jgi:ankyrin repeat protein